MWILLFFCQLILVDQLLHVFRAGDQIDGVVNDDHRDTGTVGAANFLIFRRTVADGQELFQSANTFAIIDVGIFDIVLGKNLFHRWAAASGWGSVENDLTHDIHPFFHSYKTKPGAFCSFLSI